LNASDNNTRQSQTMGQPGVAKNRPRRRRLAKGLRRAAFASKERRLKPRDGSEYAIAFRFKTAGCLLGKFKRRFLQPKPQACCGPKQEPPPHPAIQSQLLSQTSCFMRRGNRFFQIPAFQQYFSL